MTDAAELVKLAERAFWDVCKAPVLTEADYNAARERWYKAQQTADDEQAGERGDV